MNKYEKKDMVKGQLEIIKQALWTLTNLRVISDDVPDELEEQISSLLLSNKNKEENKDD